MLAKFFQYAYLIFGALFLYDGISKWENDKNGSYVSLGLAALAIFMFFFRQKFRKKYENKDT